MHAAQPIMYDFFTVLLLFPPLCPFAGLIDYVGCESKGLNVLDGAKSAIVKILKGLQQSV